MSTSAGDPSARDHDLPPGPFDAAGLILRVRRIADLSQRDLARVVGTTASTVSRWESGDIAPRLGTLVEVLSVAGLRVAVVDAHGHEVTPFHPETARDNQGRRFPAHLDVAPPDEVPDHRRYFPRYDRPTAKGWYHLRTRRDEIRDQRGATPVSHPTLAELEEHRIERRYGRFSWYQRRKTPRATGEVPGP